MRTGRPDDHDVSVATGFRATAHSAGYVVTHLYWLHLSDFHFAASGDEFSQGVAMQALLNDLRARASDQPHLDFVVVTGDIAFSGRPEEYARATEFLSSVASAVGVSEERFFFVPGNHDVDRTRHRLAFEGACSQLTSQSSVDRLLGSPEDLYPLIDRQVAFWNFVSSFTRDQERTHTADGLGYVAPLAIDHLRISMLGLNSAWLSGRDSEEMKMVIGERQVINAIALGRATSPHLLIALAHHPVHWLREWDQVSCNNRLLNEVDIYMRGHLHTAQVTLGASPESPCLSIAAGAGHATRFYGNSYNSLELDLGTGACVVQPTDYNPDDGHFSLGVSVHGSVALANGADWDREELAHAIKAAVPTADPFAFYLADLLTGIKSEIPVEVDGAIEFSALSVATAIGTADLDAAVSFMRLRNLLAIHDDVPLDQRAAEHAGAIEAFVAYLSRATAIDETSEERLTVSHRSRPHPSSTPSHLLHTIDFLHYLRSQADWHLLEEQSERYLENDDPGLSRLAKETMIEALMHSDDGPKRKRAAQLARDLTATGHASASDYLLAAASAELADDTPRAIVLIVDALASWPADYEVRQFARGLALRTGNSELRAAAEGKA